VRVTYYDDFSRCYKLKAPYATALWVTAAGALFTWIALIW
jgi:hypothetical protein